MVNVKICGSCVSRDTFGFNQKDEFIVKEFIHFSSPLSMNREPVKSISEFALCHDFVEKSAFVRKSIIRDITKNAISELLRADADWLIVDISHIRHPLLKISDQEGNETLVTFSREARNELTRMFIENDKYDTEIIKPWEWEDTQIEKEMRTFSERIKAILPERNIILLELENTRYYLDSSGDIKTFSLSGFELNFFIKKCFAYLKSYLREAKVVSLPKYVLADEGHKWGVFPLHYSEAYYDYSYQTIKCITENKPDEEIERLYRKIEDYYEELWYRKLRIKEVMQNVDKSIGIERSASMIFNEDVAKRRGEVTLTKSQNVVHLAAYFNLFKSEDKDLWVIQIPEGYRPTARRDDFGYIACGNKVPIIVQTDGTIVVVSKREHDWIFMLDLTWETQ